MLTFTSTTHDPDNRLGYLIEETGLNAAEALSRIHVVCAFSPWSTTGPGRGLCDLLDDGASIIHRLDVGGYV